MWVLGFGFWFWVLKSGQLLCWLVEGKKKGTGNCAFFFMLVFTYSLRGVLTITSTVRVSKRPSAVLLVP